MFYAHLPSWKRPKFSKGFSGDEYKGTPLYYIVQTFHDGAYPIHGIQLMHYPIEAWVDFKYKWGKNKDGEEVVISFDGSNIRPLCQLKDGSIGTPKHWFLFDQYDTVKRIYDKMRSDLMRKNQEAQDAYLNQLTRKG